MWRFKEFDADRFLQDFSTRYYGADHAAEIARLYRDYYQSYWKQKPADIPGFDRQYIFQDMRYARATEMLLKDMAANISRPNPLDGNPLDDPSKGSVGYFRVELQPGEATQLDALLRGTAESGKKFAAVAERGTALLPSTGAGRIFFNDNLVVRAKIMAALNALLHETALAYQANGVRAERKQHLAAAIVAADAVKAALDETKHGTFGEWYKGDEKFGLQPLRASLKTELDRVQ
jgi:hypothetical protein